MKTIAAIVDHPNIKVDICSERGHFLSEISGADHNQSTSRHMGQKRKALQNKWLGTFRQELEVGDQIGWWQFPSNRRPRSHDRAAAIYEKEITIAPTTRFDGIDDGHFGATATSRKLISQALKVRTIANGSEGNEQDRQFPIAAWRIAIRLATVQRQRDKFRVSVTNIKCGTASTIVNRLADFFEPFRRLLLNVRIDGLAPKNPQRGPLIRNEHRDARLLRRGAMGLDENRKTDWSIRLQQLLKLFEQYRHIGLRHLVTDLLNQCEAAPDVETTSIFQQGVR